MRFIAIEVGLELLEGLREPVKGIRRANRDLGDQLLRAAVSVVSNIEEGRGRAGGDRRHLWTVAFGSAREVKIQLRSALALGYLGDESGTRLVAQADRLVALCYGLARSRN